MRTGVASPTIVLNCNNCQSMCSHVTVSMGNAGSARGQDCSSLSTRRQRSLGSHGNTGEAYLLASLNSEIAAMLLLRVARAESTPAVTSAASCTMRLWLITPANSRSSSLPVPLDLYSSYVCVSGLLCSTWVLSPYFSCCGCAC